MLRKNATPNNSPNQTKVVRLALKISCQNNRKVLKYQRKAKNKRFCKLFRLQKRENKFSGRRRERTMVKIPCRKLQNVVCLQAK